MDVQREGEREPQAGKGAAAAGFGLKRTSCSRLFQPGYARPIAQKTPKSRSTNRAPQW